MENQAGIIKSAEDAVGAMDQLLEIKNHEDVTNNLPTIESKLYSLEDLGKINKTLASMSSAEAKTLKDKISEKMGLLAFWVDNILLPSDNFDNVMDSIEKHASSVCHLPDSSEELSIEKVAVHYTGRLPEVSTLPISKAALLRCVLVIGH